MWFLEILFSRVLEKLRITLLDKSGKNVIKIGLTVIKFYGFITFLASIKVFYIQSFSLSIVILEQL